MTDLTKRYYCNICDKSVSEKKALKRHQKSNYCKNYHRKEEILLERKERHNQDSRNTYERHREKILKKQRENYEKTKEKYKDKKKEYNKKYYNLQKNKDKREIKKIMNDIIRHIEYSNTY